MKPADTKQRSAGEPKRPWLGPCVFAMLFILGGGAAISLSLMNDVRLVGGYEFLSPAIGPALLVRVLGVLVPIASLYILGRDSVSRERWTNVSLAICGALLVHVPVFYLLGRHAAYMITVVLVLGVATLWVTRTKRFSENLEWFRGR